MKTTLIMTLLVSVVGISAAQAAEKTLTPQQQRMATCNQQASAKAVKGDERKAFMSNCLKGGSEDGKALTPQQQKMKDCNAQAGKQSLSGDARKTFMSSCLKK
ncbi:PsiF family protein [Entomohabitans teleogrylli]|uniref:PsiF family protein n=1 Tax=Entomohabitans teleogrylli TaxID=1384589 RepID=UPI00073D308F|nr:PsiF family protein [Entomohabitans teleogrylli]